MIKVVTTLKKKAGLSTEEFRAYYENNHRLIGEKYLSGYAVKYVRRYLEPMPGADGVCHEPEYDVLLELWFPDQDTWQACAANLSTPEAAREIARDEEQLFDRSRKRSYVVKEVESNIAGAKP